MLLIELPGLSPARFRTNQVLVPLLSNSGCLQTGISMALQSCSRHRLIGLWGSLSTRAIWPIIKLLHGSVVHADRISHTEELILLLGHPNRTGAIRDGL